MTKPEDPSSRKVFELLPKIGNYLVGITVLCYGAGFAITNLYLGSMGIVTFDILRARYIIAGILFIFFLGAIAYLVAGLLQTLRKHFQKPRIVVVLKVLWFSLVNISLLYFVIPAVGLFAGSIDTQTYYIPQPIQPEIPWSDWFARAPLSALRFTSILFVLMILAVFLVFAIVIIINPKDKNGLRTSRKQTLVETYQKIRESKGKEFAPLIGLFVLLYLLNLSVSLLSFYLAGKVSTITKTAFSFPNGWTQLFNAIVIVYAFIAIYLLLIALYPSSTNISTDTVQSKSYSWIYITAICIIIIVPIYASRVYPNLPQQIGGGQLRHVQVVISDNAIEPLFGDTNAETYLIDRTSTTSFFLLQNITKSQYKIVEIQNELILHITYAHYP